MIILLRVESWKNKIKEISQDVLEGDTDTVKGYVQAALGAGAAPCDILQRIYTLLSGGVSAVVTVEHGTPQEICDAVDHAIGVLGPNGFYLSPIDNLTVDQPQTWKYIKILIDAWKNHW